MTTITNETSVPEIKPQVSRQTTREEVSKAIQQLTSTNEKAVESFIDWIQGIVEQARTCEYKEPYLLGRRDRRKHHHLLEVVLPAGQAAEPGSARALLERFVLDPTRQEFSLIHGSEEQNRIRFCTVQVRRVDSLHVGTIG